MLAQKFWMGALMVGALGCASGPASSASTPAETAPSGNPDIITAAELADPMLSQGDALAAVKRLRPRFLATRGATSINGGTSSTKVSVNEGGLQAVEALSRIRASEVLEIRYLNPSSAAQRFGMAAGSASVLMVKTR